MSVDVMYHLFCRDRNRLIAKIQEPQMASKMYKQKTNQFKMTTLFNIYII